MTDEQQKAALSLRTALLKVKKARLSLRVYDGHVYVVPRNVELWPNGADGDVIAVLDEHGEDVTPLGDFDADGGAGR